MAWHIDAVFKDQGAIRVVEAWGDDVPKGNVTDFQRTVQAKDNERVVFSWIEWPDKASRDAVMARSEEWMKDPRLDPEKNPMPFDGKRMIYGGFATLRVGRRSAGKLCRRFRHPRAQREEGRISRHGSRSLAAVQGVRRAAARRDMGR